MQTFAFTPVATVRSPFKEKFGVPRQGGMIGADRSRIEFLPPCCQPEMVCGLEGFSHIWIQFVFHLTLEGGWRPMVRPPRLGGNSRVGVFASRAPYRPNPIGLSVVRLEAVHASPAAVWLEISGADLVDGTPVLDVKPYLPYADALPGARSGFAPHPPGVRLSVEFSADVEQQLGELEDGPALRQLIREVLEADPRPAYRAATEDSRGYGVRLDHFDIKWRVSGGRAIVTALVTAGASSGNG